MYTLEINITFSLELFHPKVWNFETIDSAEASDEHGAFEMEPMNELCIGHDVHLKSLSKSVDENDANIWYGQVCPYPQ